MRLDGFGIPGKDGTLFLLYGRKDFETMTASCREKRIGQTPNIRL